MPSNIVRTLGNLGADALSLIRAFHPMVVCFAGALAGTALVFDALYVLGGTGLGLAALYTLPLLAGLIGCLIAGADDMDLSGPVLWWTVATTLAGGLTNISLVMMLGAMWRTGPGDWAAGGQAVLMSAVSVPVIALNLAVIRELAHTLGLTLRTKLPAPKPRKPPVEAAPRKPGLYEQLPGERAVKRDRPQQVKESAPAPIEAESTLAVLDSTRWRAVSSKEAADPVAPAAKDATPVRDVYPVEPRPVTSTGETGHGGRRVAASRRTIASPRNSPRPGRRPGQPRPDAD
ncbi:hypothetical protein [Kribbella deserti]|uniref:DUF2637 domain-containing protein n=1 Tax=Kribbella deserti TaxID=1926257 RepID=A0ABV6QES9_9ACTN